MKKPTVKEIKVVTDEGVIEVREMHTTRHDLGATREGIHWGQPGDHKNALPELEPGKIQWMPPSLLQTMTLRDYFAAQAMFLVSPDYGKGITLGEAAYKLADDMLAERAKGIKTDD